VARRRDVQETARGKDRYCPKLLWKVADVSRHDVVGLRFNRKFQNLIVVAISCGNDLKARIYQDRCRTQRAERLNNIIHVIIHVELEFSSLQDLKVFFKNFLGTVTLEISGKGKSED
jgi:hypothetical protein